MASRLRPGAVIGYHSALELHGCAYSAEFDIQVIAAGEPGSFQTAEFTCRFVRPAAALDLGSVATTDRVGQTVPLTTLERTVADVFDRPDLAGGAEELLNSLDLIVRLNGDMLARHLAANRNTTAAGVAGAGRGGREGRSAPDWNVVLPAQVIDAGFEGL